MQSISVVAVEIDDAYAAQPKCHLNLSRQSIFELYKQLDSGQSAKMQIAGLTVYAIEDEEYYKDRIAGFILPVDDPTTEKVLHWESMSEKPFVRKFKAQSEAARLKAIADGVLIKASELSERMHITIQTIRKATANNRMFAVSNSNGELY